LIWAIENAGFNAKVQQKLVLDFCNKTAQIIAKTSTRCSHVNFPTFFMADPRYGGLIRAKS